MPAKLKKMFAKAMATLKDSKGQGLVEYALILVLIALVVLAALTNVGNKASEKFSTINSALNR